MPSVLRPEFIVWTMRTLATFGIITYLFCETGNATKSLFSLVPYFMFMSLPITDDLLGKTTFEKFNKEMNWYSIKFACLGLLVAILIGIKDLNFAYVCTCMFAIAVIQLRPNELESNTGLASATTLTTANQTAVRLMPATATTAVSEINTRTETETGDIEEGGEERTQRLNAQGDQESSSSALMNARFVSIMQPNHMSTSSVQLAQPLLTHSITVSSSSDSV